MFQECCQLYFWKLFLKKIPSRKMRVTYPVIRKQSKWKDWASTSAAFKRCSFLDHQNVRTVAKSSLRGLSWDSFRWRWTFYFLFYDLAFDLLALTQKFKFYMHVVMRNSQSKNNLCNSLFKEYKHGLCALSMISSVLQSAVNSLSSFLASFRFIVKIKGSLKSRK